MYVLCALYYYPLVCTGVLKTSSGSGPGWRCIKFHILCPTLDAYGKLYEQEKNILFFFSKFVLTRSRLIYTSSAQKVNWAPSLHEYYYTVTQAGAIEIWDESNAWRHYILNAGMCWTAVEFKSHLRVWYRIVFLQILTQYFCWKIRRERRGRERRGKGKKKKKKLNIPPREMAPILYCNCLYKSKKGYKKIVYLGFLNLGRSRANLGFMSSIPILACTGLSMKTRWVW